MVAAIALIVVGSGFLLTGLFDARRVTVRSRALARPSAQVPGPVTLSARTEAVVDHPRRGLVQSLLRRSA